MVCQNYLLKSIQAVHKTVMTYSNCISSDDEVDAEKQEQETFQKFGLELSTQLATLRNMYIEKFGVDPITGRPQEILLPCRCQQNIE
ncbi:hypothetical protein WGM54_18260 [Paenibacillus polymyxa]|uniref:hypothetical protein n=1 Tax=Paenibacillus polymyxa TaxID=1406 RepID=UPI00307F2B2A